MAGNPAFVERCGFKREEEIVGITDGMIFPAKLAEKYRRDDERVMATGKPLLGLIELFPNRDGKPEWFITDKLPLFDHDGRVCGLCGTVRSYEAQRAAMLPYLELAVVADHLKTCYREKLDLPSLARMVGMSVRQFERKFRATFQMTPRGLPHPHAAHRRLRTPCPQQPGAHRHRPRVRVLRPQRLRPPVPPPSRPDREPIPRRAPEKSPGSRPLNASGLENPGIRDNTM